MSRFVANRTLTSLSAIYRHYNARTKSEKSTAVTKAYATLNRSAKGRVVRAAIEKRRASARKAAATRRENRERAQRRYTADVQDYYGTHDEYDYYPDVPIQRNRNYSQRHAYVIRLEWLTTGVTANGPTAQTTYTMATYLSDTPLTVGELDRMVWQDYGDEMAIGGPMGDSYVGTDTELTGWGIVAHYVSSTKGRRSHAA